MENLKQYIKALTNFYGMVHKDKIVKVYNIHNEDKISRADVEICTGNFTKEFEDDFVYLHEDYFVQESILQFDKFHKMLANKAHKPYYIPDKQELLNYLDVWYIDKTRQYNDLLEYLSNYVVHKDIPKAETLCEAIYRVCQGQFVMQEVFDVFNYEEIIFENKNQAEKVLHLVAELSNNMRLWQHNGFTALEVLDELAASSKYPTPEACESVEEITV